MTPLLEARQVTKVFPRASSVVEVLRGCDFSLSEGESVAVTGSSGSGKSTLLNILGGLDTPDEGTVAFRGEALQFDNHKAMARWRSRGVGFIFQFHFLLPDFTALENLMIPVRALGSVTDEHRDRALGFLEATGLADRADHLPGELSGGEQQRVAVARAFMNQPRIVLADEPFGNLDREIGTRLGDMLFGLAHQTGAGLVVVTHDPHLAERTDRGLHLLKGHLEPLRKERA